MKWFILLVGVIVLCFVVALILGLVGGGMGGPSASLAHERLPEEELKDEDLDELVFDVALRGYRMSQVDGVVDRLRRELRDKDDQIAVLQGGTRVERPEPQVPAVPAEASTGEQGDTEELGDAGRARPHDAQKA